MNTEIRKCNCGCGENIAGKANYRPGHDARHVGQVARALLADERNVAARKEYDHMSPALQSKVERFIANRAGTVAAAPKDTGLVVKVGRWTYPARALENGTSERNTARDGSGDWVKVSAQALMPA